MLMNLLLQYFVLQSVHYLHNTIPSKRHKRRTSSEEDMSKISNLPVAGNATKLPDNEANNKEFQRPNPKGMTSRMLQERIDVLKCQEQSCNSHTNFFSYSTCLMKPQMLPFILFPRVRSTHMGNVG